jgi:hypothetical protein
MSLKKLGGCIEHARGRAPNRTLMARRIVLVGLPLFQLSFLLGCQTSTSQPEPTNEETASEIENVEAAEGDPLDNEKTPSDQKSSKIEDSQNRRKTDKTKSDHAKNLPSALPLPKRTSFFALKSFMEEYSDAAKPSAALEEYRLYFKSLSETQDDDDGRMVAVRARIHEDFPRAHWAFVAGVLELQDYIVNKSSKSLQIDKEKNFLSRMKVLTLVASGLDEVSDKEKKYTGMIREVYKNLSENVFGRKLKIRNAP